jgi:phosphatidylinositol 4-kinase A
MYGNNRIQLMTDSNLLQGVANSLDRDGEIGEDNLELKRLLQILLKDETFRVQAWLSPLKDDASVMPVSLDETVWPGVVRLSWKLDPYLAVHLSQRFVSQSMKKEIRRLILANPEDVIHSPLAAEIMLGDNLSIDLTFQLKVLFSLYIAHMQQLLFWSPVVPPTAITYFLQSFGNNPLILQYAMRSLLHHPIPVTFFYVPQVVQALRYDELGYVEQFIMEASLLSPLFAHQIIWNMNANAYKDEDSTIPDPLKPVLDRLTHRMTDALSGEDKDFYEREFSFFNEVTSISGKLKPFIKRPKPEKKAKIDEEMKKIKLDVGVYLPSNPDGDVIGIDRKSGRPLQSHAKAPFMATFRIKRVRKLGNGNSQDMVDGADEGETVTEVMQSAIFKVGDDCRQDVLALQLISAFRNIFNSVGLDLYLFPYRVTATAPGVSNSCKRG